MDRHDSQVAPHVDGDVARLDAHVEVMVTVLLVSSITETEFSLWSVT